MPGSTSSSPNCLRCGARLAWAATGRPKRYCSTRCRVAAHRARPVQLQLVDQPEPAAAEPAPAEDRRATWADVFWTPPKR